MENELFPRECVEPLIGHTLTDVTFKKDPDKCWYMKWHFGEMTSEWRLPFTPAEHQLAIVEEALKRIYIYGNTASREEAGSAIRKMKEFCK